MNHMDLYFNNDLNNSGDEAFHPKVVLFKPKLNDYIKMVVYLVVFMVG